LEVSVFDARNRLSELIEAAERGEEVIVTKRGRPVVRLTPFNETELRTKQTLAALARADRIAAAVEERMGRPFTHDELIAARDEGRR
jgi:prevent-host-death family protein